MIRKWLYHASFPPFIFEGTERELEKLSAQGWVDSPRDTGRAVVREVAPAEEPEPPLPDDYDSVDAFMQAFVEFEPFPKDVDPRTKAARLKAGLEQYSLVKLGRGINRRGAVAEIRDDIMRAETNDE